VQAGLPHLNPEDLFAVLIVPSGSLSFLSETSGTVVLSNQIHRNPPQETNIPGALSFANATVVLPETDVQDPVDPVFNPRVGANRLRDALRVGWKTADVIAPPEGLGPHPIGSVLAELVLAPPRFDHRKASKPGPLVAVVEPADVIGRPTPADLNTPVSTVNLTIPRGAMPGWPRSTASSKKAVTSP